MENEDNSFLNNDNYDEFGPHIKIVENNNKSYIKNFFTTSYNGQDVKNNLYFINWKNKLKTNEIIIFCPQCSTYFSKKIMSKTECPKCAYIFCNGCKRQECNFCCKEFFNVFKNILSYLSTKGYGNINICLKILMYFAMIFQLWFSYPIQIMYYFGPMIYLNEDKVIKYDDKYRKKGLLFCLIMIPYQIAFFGIYFSYLTFLIILLLIIYPPFSFNLIGMIWYIKRHFFIENRNIKEYEKLFQEEFL